MIDRIEIAMEVVGDLELDVTPDERKKFAELVVTRFADRLNYFENGFVRDSVLLDALKVMGNGWDVRHRIYFQMSMSGTMAAWFGARCHVLPKKRAVVLREPAPTRTKADVRAWREETRGQVC